LVADAEGVEGGEVGELEEVKDTIGVTHCKKTSGVETG
jgi:hypothetical protein